MAKKAKNQKAKLGRKKRVEEGKKESESKKNSLPVNANLRNETRKHGNRRVHYDERKRGREEFYQKKGPWKM